MSQIQVKGEYYEAPEAVVGLVSDLRDDLDHYRARIATLEGAWAGAEQNVRMVREQRDAAEAQRDRLREALEKIINGISTHSSPSECRAIARAALKEPA